MKHTAILLLVLMGFAAYANSTNEQVYLAKLNAAGVDYVYSNEGRLRILSTERTDEIILDLILEAPKSLEVEVVPYVLGEKE